MPMPLSPSSSQEIIVISPSIEAGPSKPRVQPVVAASASSTTIARPARFEPTVALKEKTVKHVRAQRHKNETMGGKRKADREDMDRHRKRVARLDRAQAMEHMISTLGNGVNPITDSDLYSRTDHFVSASTGHQQSNRGGGSAGAKTYWDVRTAKMLDQAREQKSDILKGCVFYINGSTGPRVSNLQLQHMITSNGGRFLPMQSSSCTHIVASGLSGSKTQKFIDGQGGRGASQRAKVVRVEWVLDCVDKGMRLSEIGYGVIEDPSQKTLFAAFGVMPKIQSELEAEKDR